MSATPQNPSSDRPGENAEKLFDIADLNDQSINTLTTQDITQVSVDPISFGDEESKVDASSIDPSSNNASINKTLSDISDTERNDIFYFLQALDSDSSDDQEFVEFIHLLAEKN